LGEVWDTIRVNQMAERRKNVRLRMKELEENASPSGEKFRRGFLKKKTKKKLTLGVCALEGNRQGTTLRVGRGSRRTLILGRFPLTREGRINGKSPASLTGKRR